MAPFIKKKYVNYVHAFVSYISPIVIKTNVVCLSFLPNHFKIKLVVLVSIGMKYYEEETTTPMSNYYDLTPAL